ncbi:SWIM zinc finger family protein [Halobacteria archaeon HArc-gm2]|nr:SWIM zinc finger family protein [Halobacteria archaeon HArc-gm2]
MNTKNSAAEKRIAVDHLNFGAKTSKRVGWEAWEFSVEAPHLVRVTNAAYGFEKDDHSYLVGIEDRDGLLVPSECECKADQYNEEYDCKHKVALATIGGPVVLQAAVDCPTPGVDATETPSQSLEEPLRTDGGTATEVISGGPNPLYAEEHRECDCRDLADDFPCWNCVRDGERELPE